MLVLDYVHYGYNDIKTLEAYQDQSILYWSFDAFKTVHTGSKECFESIVSNIRMTATILLLEGDLNGEKEELVLDI